MWEKDRDKFFQLVQKEANYIDLANLKPVYYALLRTVIKGLKVNGRIVLPDFGEFMVTTHKARRSVSVNNPNEILNLPEMNTVKYSPCKMMKAYVKNLHKK